MQRKLKNAKVNIMKIRCPAVTFKLERDVVIYNILYKIESSPNNEDPLQLKAFAVFITLTALSSALLLLNLHHCFHLCFDFHIL